MSKPVSIGYDEMDEAVRLYQQKKIDAAGLRKRYGLTIASFYRIYNKFYRHDDLPPRCDPKAIKRIRLELQRRSLEVPLLSLHEKFALMDELLSFYDTYDLGYVLNVPLLHFKRHQNSQKGTQS